MPEPDISAQAVTPPERRIYNGAFFTIGIFRCPVCHPFFSRRSVIRGGHLIVFPRTGVLIDQVGRHSVVADPNVAIFYNDRQHYSRRKLSEHGDHCDFFGFASGPVTEALADIDPGVVERPDQPFCRASGPVGASTILAQRSLLAQVLAVEYPDRLVLDEAVLWLLRRVICESAGSVDTRQEKPERQERRRQEELVDAARAFLAGQYDSSAGLTAIARAVGSSEYHLCRLFRRHTGTTLARYRNQLRLRASLERLLDTDRSLTELALDLGYSSHSHFSASFRRLFGMTPSQLRVKATGALFRKLSKISIAPECRFAE